ncbi:MAG: glycosyltransferase family 39 protein [Solirubrobacterales bacterium]|nr:glycosyltransferase family 39 protein [Solirubrobacterales bacterium]
MRRRRRGAEWAAVAAITLAAAVLRLLAINKVSPDPFYDAAVRSMSLSWHSFFFGAFEPSGSVSIDKPPLDLWLQVISVKIFGFSSTTLKLPEAFAGIASVPLSYAAVRRVWNVPAGLAAAAAMAVLPVEVITSRSDTMDAVMMALIIVGLLCVVRSVEGGRTGWLLAGAAVLGLAFNVKLLESLVALPGIALLALLGLPGGFRRRARQIALASVVYVAVALSWLTATQLAPAHDRPWAIGSSNGSAWNAAFVFNGTERLGGKSPEPQGTVYEAGHRYPTSTQSERDHIPILPPSATRLLARIGPLSGQRLGLEMLIALLLGIPALIWGLRAEHDADPGRERAQAMLRGDASRTPSSTGDPTHQAGTGAQTGAAERPSAGEHQADAGRHAGAQAPADASESAEAPATPMPPASAPASAGTPAQSRARVRRAAAAGLGLWMLTGIVLFSHMERLHPRYVEGFTPVVAAMLGIGVAWAAGRRGLVRLVILAGALLIAVYYSERLLYGTPSTWWFALLGALAALALALLMWLPGTRSARASALLATGAIAASLVAVLAVPFKADVTAIENHVTDAGYVGALPTEEQQLISSYLRAHQRGARYEVAAESATQIGSLIVQDARPILVLTTYNGRVFTSVAALQRLSARGEVRYAFLNTFCTSHASVINPACSAPAKWIRAHASDVSREAGLPHSKILYRLPGVSP